MGWRTGNFGVINGHVGVLFVGRAADAAISHGEKRKNMIIFFMEDRRAEKLRLLQLGSNGHFLWAKKDSEL
jgi:hypothetical protein